MAQHWPRSSQVSLQDREHLISILNWCRFNYGDYSWQHWTFQIDGSHLTVYFVGQSQKTEFDLTWG